MNKYEDFLGLGIAGNFALHLDQAGEAVEFKDIITADEAAPKGMFPFYFPVPCSAKKILHTYPLSHDTLKLPASDVNVQAEPEVGLICELNYKDGVLSSITPTHFGAYNDCSIRIAGAAKISDKKNWGASSKGVSDTLIKIDKFSHNGIMDNYSICSFLKRDDELKAYGEDARLTGYSYFYEKLLSWMLHQLNTQKDFGPLEELSKYIKESDNPKKAIISIGATRYTSYGEKTFLKKDDEIIIAIYNRNDFSINDVTTNIKNNSFDKMSVLAQKVI
ncbi:DUF5718 family protein [Sulfurimonas sp.]|uniref:DUF5718 family protein n=1 Tax=Sulfurimonas sp. TaxID=2022749 RepID=UPI002B47AECC|nr:DUF5718 family protein [Sulfurimonas sp.]